MKNDTGFVKTTFMHGLTDKSEDKPKMEEPPNGAYIEGVFFSNEELKEATIKANAEDAVAGIMPDWFDYLRQERNEFVTKFWQMYTDYPIGTKEQTMAENILIAYDQMFEHCALIYAGKLQTEQPDSTLEDIIELLTANVFGDFKAPSNIEEAPLYKTSRFNDNEEQLFL